MKKTVAITAALAAITLTSCAQADTAPDQNGLVYNHGPIESTTFNKCVGPGTKQYEGYDDQVFYYPAGQRTYMFANTEGADTAPFTAPTRDNIMLTITGTLRFELTDDCKLLQQFHEKIGLKDEWKVVLKTYLEQPLDRAITEATQDQDWLSIYSDPAQKSAGEKRVLDLLPGYVKQGTGGDYFGKFGLTLQKPELPQALNEQLLAVQAAIQGKLAQDEENKRIASVVDGTKAQIEMLGPDNYVLLEAIRSGKVTFMPIPEGSPVMVAPK